MKLPVANARGEDVGAVEVDERVFGIKPNRAVVHQTLLAHLANRRAGGASTKTRGEVRGSTAKIRRQKGTGRARLGSSRAPHLRHGGIVFGPKPRSYVQRVPKRMRRLAVRSVLSDKVAEGRLRVVDALQLEKPRTKEVVGVLEALGFQGPTLIITGAPDHALSLGARNIPETKVMPAAYLNVVDLLSYRGLLMTVEAVREAERLWGGERAQRRRAPIPPVEAVAAAPATTRRRKAAAPKAAPAKAPRAKAKAAPVEVGKAPPSRRPRQTRAAGSVPKKAAPPAKPRRRKAAGAPES